VVPISEESPLTAVTTVLPSYNFSEEMNSSAIV